MIEHHYGYAESALDRTVPDYPRDYDYFDGVPPPKDMVKYHGVGQYLYPNVDPTKLSEQDWIAVRDGISDFGTRKDQLKRQDFEAITYEWFMKVSQPSGLTAL